MPIDVYGVGGYKSVLAGSIKGRGTPTNTFGIELGQSYFDMSTSPPTQWVFNGVTWVQGGASGVSAVFASPPPIGSTTPNTGAFTTVTATGNITTTGGNVVISGAARQLQVEGGAVTDFIGTATLVAGTVTIANTNIAATDKVLVTRSALNASPALGFLVVTKVASTSFTVASFTAAGAAATTDVSSFDYFIVRQL